ncbi:MAG: acylphosphatase [Candidatus Omnitrophica bacterium]|nr:acylphosphatase [Candidatus Omnitrophota bacterium]
MNQSQRIHVIYTGNVHGVGFRFTAERVARRLGVSGFVKNLPDGTVEAMCEGSEEELKSFLKDIKENMRGYVSDSQIAWRPATGEFASFEIRF